MENNQKVFRTGSEVNESLKRIESFLDYVKVLMSNTTTYGIGHLKFFDEDGKTVDELQAAFKWVSNSLQNDTERQLIDMIKASSARIYEKMSSVSELIRHNTHKDTNKWLNIEEPPTVTGTYNATARIASTQPSEYNVVQVYYDLETKKWYIDNDTYDTIFMWFKSY